MDQRKIGSFLKDLRKEKNLTQEQLAQILCVSNRSISRWETGSNLPDLSLLIEIADYYNVELRELLDGERKNQHMNKEEQETVLKVASYSNNEKMKLTKRMHYIFIIGVIAFIIYMILDINKLTNTTQYEFIASYMLGIVFGILIVGAIFTSSHINKIREMKMKLLKHNK